MNETSKNGLEMTKPGKKKNEKLDGEKSTKTG